VGFEPRDKVSVAFLDAEAIGIGPSGRAIPVPAGAYKIVAFDGQRAGMIMLADEDDRPVAMMGLDYVDHIEEVLDGPYPLEWAAYHREKPHVLASWAEQNGRRPWREEKS
jgi:hypothetical protein